MNGPDAGGVSRALAARIEALCLELLPSGHREGAEWVSASVRGTSRRALTVRLFGAKAGVWMEGDSGAAGDALDLVAHVRFNGDKRAAYRWALAWLGLGAVAPGAPLSRAPAPAAEPDTSEAEAAAKRRSARALWLDAKPSIIGTPAGDYLKARGIDLAQLGRQPASLRFAPALPNREAGRTFPALVAAISGPGGEHMATHRTWLSRNTNGTWGKAPLKSARMALGSFAGGAIRLWRGASGRPLATAPETDVVVIAEGIETALSIAVACPELRVMAAVTLGNMASIMLPPKVIDVIVAADNDQGNPAAERLLDKAVARLLAQGRSVRVARSSIGSDFNDGLRGAAA